MVSAACESKFVDGTLVGSFVDACSADLAVDGILMTKVLFFWHQFWAATRHRKYDYHLRIDRELEFSAFLDPLFEACKKEYLTISHRCMAALKIRLNNDS